MNRHLTRSSWEDRRQRALSLDVDQRGSAFSSTSSTSSIREVFKRMQADPTEYVLDERA